MKINIGKILKGIITVAPVAKRVVESVKAKEPVREVAEGVVREGLAVAEAIEGRDLADDALYQRLIDAVVAAEVEVLRARAALDQFLADVRSRR